MLVKIFSDEFVNSLNVSYDAASKTYDAGLATIKGCECEHEAGSCSSSTMIAASIMAIFARFLF